MNYQIYGLKCGEKDYKESQFFFMETSDAPLTLYFYLWVILGGPHPVVVDTGFSHDDARQWEMRQWVGAADLLARVGVKAAEVPLVIISHLHWDHWDGYEYFPSADFWIQEEEIDFWTGFAGCYPVYRQFATATALGELVRLNYGGRIRRLRGEVPVLPGITAYWVGGHTPGSQILTVSTAKGPVVLAVDASHCYRNIERRQPTQLITNLPQMLQAFDRIEALAGPSRLIVPGHDPAVARRFDEIEPGVIRVA
jgi:glyoxylase-like metal-dependent hydrolase (beta-lactamase superfamily II)